MPRPRFTLRPRTLLAIVMVCGVLLGLAARSQVLYRRAMNHAALARPEITYGISGGEFPSPVSSITPLGRWHLDLAIKYRHAARRPWLPVAADPPPPASAAKGINP